MKSLSGQLDTISKAYEHEFDVVLATFEKFFKELQDNERALKAMMEQQKQEAIELSKIEVEYRPLKRAADQEEKMYGVIASRQKEIDITGLMKTNNVRVLERAVVPSVPVRPRPLQNLMLGLLLVLGTGIGLAFLIEALDNTLKTQADVEQLLGTPVLGLVPIIGGSPRAEVVETSDKSDNLRDRDLGIFLDP